MGEGGGGRGEGGGGRGEGGGEGKERGGEGGGEGEGEHIVSVTRYTACRSAGS